MADASSNFAWVVLGFKYDDDEQESLTHLEVHSTESSANTAASDLLVKNAQKNAKKTSKSPKPTKDSESKFGSIESFTLTSPDLKNSFKVQILKNNYQSERSTATAGAESNTKGKRKAKETTKDTKAGNSAAKDDADPDLDDEEAPPKKVAMRKKPGVISDGKEDCLKGLKLIFTGTFESMDRKGCIDTAEKYGATIVKKMEHANYVVLGTKPGPKKLDEIKEKDVITMTEKEFLETLETGEIP